MKAYTPEMTEYKNAFVYVERTIGGGAVRRGIVGMVDLEAYNYEKGAKSPIRATEGTVVERIPPRLRVREGASMELPHIMILIDDEEKTVVEAAGSSEDKELVYDFSLSQKGGKIKGFKLSDKTAQQVIKALEKLGDIEKNLSEYDFERVTVNAGDGTAVFNIPIDRSEYYKTLSELCSVDVNSDGDIISTLMELSEIRDKYLRIEDALTDANEKGYGIVMPTVGELKLDEPTLVKQPNGYGVKVSAHADSIHMIKTGIKADLCPVIGSQEQSEEVVKFLQGEFEDNPDKVWEYNMFGRSLYDMVNDGMTAKLSHMPEESREKLGETLGKIINEGSNGLICILL